MSNLKKEGNHNKLIALAVIGAIAVGIILAAPVYAQTDNGTNNNGTSANTESQQSENHPQIQGSLKISSILDQIISKSGVTFADASTKAADAAKGNTVGGRLGIVQGYLVYDMKVLSDDGTHRVIIDAGNGSVLYVSPAHQFGGEGYFHNFGLAKEQFFKHKLLMHDGAETES